MLERTFTALGVLSAILFTLLGVFFAYWLLWGGWDATGTDTNWRQDETGMTIAPRITLEPKP